MNTILTGDCLQVMPTLPENSVDSVICDPPYGLDFMGKSWDHGVPGVEFWQAALRVAKPGAILMAFGGTRTYHRLTCAIEDAGWEIRDGMCWLYGSGFPKSLDISKAIDKAAGETREVVGQKVYAGPTGNNANFGVGNLSESDTKRDITAPATDSAKLWQGWGTALKPAWEPIIVAMKPLEGTYAENAQKWGVAGLNIDGGRIGTSKDVPTSPKVVAPSEYTVSMPGGKMSDSGFNPNIGRWPANLLLDEEAARLLDEQSGELTSGAVTNETNGHGQFYGGGYTPLRTVDHGGASRFFYTAKASSSERNAGLEDMEEVASKCAVGMGTVTAAEWGSSEQKVYERKTMTHNVHPTVKPVSLMRYLCKLTRTPTGGVVLDPFMGSGTTGIACILEHRDFIGIEIDAQYAEIARKRIADMTGPLFVTA